MKISFKLKARHGLLHEFIDKKGWSIPTFAKEVGVSYGTTLRWFNLSAFPKKKETVEKLCRLIGMIEEDLFPDRLKDPDFLDLKKEITHYKEIDPEKILGGKGLDLIEAPYQDNSRDLKMIENLWEAIEKLRYRERKMLIARYGLDGTPIKTYAAIGKEFNVSLERARQIVGRAIRILQHPINSRKMLNEKTN